MKSRGSAEELIARLAADLAPVRPVLRLRWQVLAVAAIWAAVAAVVTGGEIPRPLALGGGLSTAFAATLALVGLAGLTLGLACRIPGRETLAWLGAGGAALGVVAAIAIGAVLPGALRDAGTVAECLDCAVRALLFAIPTGLLAVALAARSAPWRPRVTGIGLAVGAISLGALIVHGICPSPSPGHWLVAHALAPLAAAFGIGMLVAGGLTLSQRRRASS